MAIIQANGVSPVTSTSTDNNGGTVRAGGKTSGTFTNVAIASESVGVFGSTVVDNDSADKALDAGKFAYDNSRPVAKKVTDKLSTVDNDYLVSGAADPENRQSIHRTDSVRTRKFTMAIRQNKWNQYSGKFDPGYPQVSNDIYYNIEADDTATTPVDDAATPTRKVPGELAYMQGGANPITDTYMKKTS